MGSDSLENLEAFVARCPRGTLPHSGLVQGKTVSKNEAHPLQSPLQRRIVRSPLTCKCLKTWRARGDSNSRPSGS